MSATTEPISVTVLVENTAAARGVLGEHGLAFWIDTSSGGVLFDTGQGAAILHNANALHLPLERTRSIVLSHGHYDHTGGLAPVLARTDRPTMMLHPAAFETKFIRKSDGTSRDVGMGAASEQALRELGGQLISTIGPTELEGGLRVTGQVPRVTDFEDAGGDFYLDATCKRPDPLFDDQTLYFDTPRGVVVLLGCAHAGVVNVLGYVKELSGGRPIRAVIGGMHLLNASPERLERTLDALASENIALLAPGHCTGIVATAMLWSRLPDRCAPCAVGGRFVFD